MSEKEPGREKSSSIVLKFLVVNYVDPTTVTRAICRKQNEE